MQRSSSIKGECVLTCRIKSIESRHSVTVEHPEMAVVARKQAGFTGSYHMIAYNVTAGSRTERGTKREHSQHFPWGNFWKVLTPLEAVYYPADVYFFPLCKTKTKVWQYRSVKGPSGEITSARNWKKLQMFEYGMLKWSAKKSNKQLP